MARTIVYIDGFNLYYRALRGTPHKWLDIAAMSAAALPRHCQIERINYYTAHISGRVDPDAPRRQHAYLRAIATLPKVVIHYGKFSSQSEVGGPGAAAGLPTAGRTAGGFAPQVAYVWKTEEKGSDVNLGVHLVRDAFRREFDIAAVLTNDTDLVEPVRIVTRELSMHVTLLAPSAKPSASPMAVSSSVRHVAPYIGPCQRAGRARAEGRRGAGRILNKNPL